MDEDDLVITEDGVVDNVFNGIPGILLYCPLDNIIDNSFL